MHCVRNKRQRAPLIVLTQSSYFSSPCERLSSTTRSCDTFTASLSCLPSRAWLLTYFSPCSQIFREVELLHKCKGQSTILQMHHFFETPSDFLFVFEKLDGGDLASHIKRKRVLTEGEARGVIFDLTTALVFIHGMGTSHLGSVCFVPRLSCPLINLAYHEGHLCVCGPTWQYSYEHH